MAPRLQYTAGTLCDAISVHLCPPQMTPLPTRHLRQVRRRHPRSTHQAQRRNQLQAIALLPLSRWVPTNTPGESPASHIHNPMATKLRGSAYLQPAPLPLRLRSPCSPPQEDTQDAQSPSEAAGPLHRLVYPLPAARAESPLLQALLLGTLAELLADPAVLSAVWAAHGASPLLPLLLHLLADAPPAPPPPPPPIAEPSTGKGGKGGKDTKGKAAPVSVVGWGGSHRGGGASITSWGGGQVLQIILPKRIFLALETFHTAGARCRSRADL